MFSKYFFDYKLFNIVNLLCFSVLFLIIVFPNSVRDIKLIIFFILGIGIIFSKTKINLPAESIRLYLIGISITLIYIIIGYSKAKLPDVSTYQVFIVYILSPIYWLVISNYLLNRFSIYFLIKIFVLYAFFATITVFIAIYLFQFGYYDILSIIIDNPNMTHSDKGVFELRLHVYGNLIFLYPAIFALFKENSKIYSILLFLFLITSLVSGRSALVLSILIGIFYLFFFIKNNFIIKIIFILLFLFISVIILNYYSLNVYNILYDFFDKILNTGGHAREYQTISLINGINDNIMGAGHGVGTSYVRSVYPWRYENLPLATIFRVGLFGFVIYAYPLIISIYRYFKIYKFSKLRPFDTFFFLGICSLSIASFTNPYLESFEFQFLFFFTYSYFARRDKCTII